MTMTTPVEHLADRTPSDTRWTTAQKVAFRLLFTIGGGLIVLSVFGSLQLNPRIDLP